jgi:hypothetical protein
VLREKISISSEGRGNCGNISKARSGAPSLYRAVRTCPPPQAVRKGGEVFTVLEGGIYSQIQEGPYNFVNSIHDHALHFFGIDYLEQEEEKPFNREIPRFNGCIHMLIICKNSNDRERTPRSKVKWA